MLTVHAAIEILLLSFVSMAFIHALFARLLLNSSGQVVCLLSVAAGAVPMALFTFLYIRAGSGTSVAWSYIILAYISLGYTYFHFFNTSETARRIRLLHEIDTAGTFTARNVAALYSTGDIITLRLQRLVNLGQLKCRGSSYSLHGRTLYYAALVVEQWRRLLGFRRDNDPGCY